MLVDAFGEQRDLNVCAAGVLLMKSKSIDFDCFCFCHFLLAFLNPIGLHATVGLARRVFPARMHLFGQNDLRHRLLEARDTLSEP